MMGFNVHLKMLTEFMFSLGKDDFHVTTLYIIRMFSPLFLAFSYYILEQINAKW